MREILGTCEIPGIGIFEDPQWDIRVLDRVLGTVIVEIIEAPQLDGEDPIGIEARIEARIEALIEALIEGTGIDPIPATVTSEESETQFETGRGT